MATDLKSAILLLSGGPDSAVLAAWAVKHGYTCRAVYVSFKDEPEELRCAKAIATEANFELDVIDCSQTFAALQNSPDDSIPFADQIAFSIVASRATTLGIDTILLGGHADDAKHFEVQKSVDAYQTMARKIVKNFQIRIPFIGMLKSEMFVIGSNMGVNFIDTISCFRPSGGKHCGDCVSCQSRYDAFKSSGIPDETAYAVQPTGNPQFGYDLKCCEFCC